MSWRRRLATSVLAVTTIAVVAAPAHAATTPANKAATWLTTQVSGGALDNGFDKVGASADGLIGLAAATDPALQPTIDKLLAYVKTGAKDYVASGGGSAAAKLAIVADAYGLDSKSFGGVDLTAAMSQGIDSDGMVGPYPSAFSSGLMMTGLKRAGESRPSALTTWLLTQQNADGGFGYATDKPSDADDTALAILGLITDNSDEAQAALAKALAWAKDAQNSDGSYAGYEPVNSTCVLAEAQLAAGVSNPKALAYVQGKQVASGAIAGSAGADAMATSQCLPLLGGTSYAEVTWRPAATGTATNTATKAPSSPSTTTSGGTTSAAATTASSTGRGVPARTGVEDDYTAPLAAASLAMGLCLAWAGRRR